MSTPSSQTKVLLSGASGYIGGTVLHTFLTSSDSTLTNLKFTALTRSQAQADAFRAQGVEPYLFTDLDYSDALTKVASEHDIVIHTAQGFHPGSAKALIGGLAERKKTTGQEDVFYIHTSGTSNIADLPISGAYIDGRVFSDTRDDVYGYLKKREAEQQWLQRETDIAVVDTGRELGVKTYILMSGNIFGTGKGAFHTNSIQIPLLADIALKQSPKQAVVVGEGKGRWDRVHVEDVSRIYALLVATLLSASRGGVPYGEKGIFFTSGSTYSWRELAVAMGKVGKELGNLEREEVKTLSLEEAGKILPNELWAELALGSNALSMADFAREVLGWKPEKSGEEHWVQGLREEWSVVGKAASSRFIS
jgi:nucleoside-diphosphate-sugar epimerase